MEIKPEHLDLFTKFLLSKGISPHSIWDYTKDVKGFLKWMYERGYLKNDIGKLLKPRKPKYVPQYITEEQIMILLKAARGSRIEAPIRIAFFTGARREEIPALKWEHIDFENKCIFIDGGKTDNSKRFVSLFDNFADFLKSLRRRGECVVMNHRDEPSTVTSLSCMLKVFKKRFEVGFDWDYQTLRRTYGATLLKRGCRIETVSRLLGHSNIKVTQDWYVKLTIPDILATIPGNALEGF